jgi:hypothetical protein
MYLEDKLLLAVQVLLKRRVIAKGPALNTLGRQRLVFKINLVLSLPR